MIVPVEILETLKCSNCEWLLSCGPVGLQPDGSNICGRCINLEEAAVPNQPYNSLAELCAFPCKYSAAGCPEMLPFSSVKQHEADCEFRTYICPVAASGSCEWMGCRNKILEHTHEQHPDQILQHPCVLKHDVKTASIKIFLTTLLDALFLIHVKICLETHTIYHSVKKIGEIYDTHSYKYEVKMQNKNGLLMRKAKVASQGCLALQEYTSLGLKINTIMEALGGYNDTTFTITLQEYMKCFICKVMKIANEMEVYNKNNNIFYCKMCSSTKLRSCKNAAAACSWKGQINYHEQYVCTYTKYCTTCKEDINELNILEHTRHKNHMSVHFNNLFEKYWSINENTKQEFLTMSFKNISFLLMYSTTNKSSHTFLIQNSIDDNKIKCILILRNSVTKLTSHYIMNNMFHSIYGQNIFVKILPNAELQPFINDNKFDIGVDIHYYE